MDQEKLEKHQGITAAERHLAHLCERTFLSLWSYPNVVRDVFVPGTKIGKEVCDLLVIFDDRVLIFSDKDCAVPRTGNLRLDWSRWFRKAVLENAKQAYGAERWLRQFPNRIFLDKACSKPLPVMPQITDRTRFHLIVVAHKIAERCRDELGGSGSLMIRSDLKGAAAHTEPFTVGDIDPTRSFVHVLDDTTLDVLMKELDTIADFVAYLDKKEEFIRSGLNIFAAGEEELLAWYLVHVNEKEEHCFKLPEGHVAGLLFEEGGYERYLRNPQSMAKVKANRISYAWDALINKFNLHAMRGTQYFPAPGGISTTERVVRWMAREPRIRRRMLARSLLECVHKTREHMRRTVVLLPSHDADPYFVFVVLPWDYERSERENREIRLSYLRAACMVVRLNYPDALDVVGIATESGSEHPRRSEDAAYGDFREWTTEMEDHARHYQQLFNKPVSRRVIQRTEPEYPDLDSVSRLRRVGRNEPCPCGSGKKYKKCHGGNSRAAS